MSGLNLVVISPPHALYLSQLQQLPHETTITVAEGLEGLERAAPDADVILNGFSDSGILRQVFNRSKKVRWVHSLSAGVENVLFPELIESTVPLTNARGVFKESLAEFVIASALFFAKDLRRMVRNQTAKKWDPFDVELLYEQTMGIVGYGEIGSASARRAKALGMKILATRRRPTLMQGDAAVDEAFAVERRTEMIAQSDYVVVSAPNTPETLGMIGEKEIAAMKPGAVLINVGRGPVVDESALVRALQENRIKGAALDVFDTEPVPEGHPFWSMENVLLSPHCADHTRTWLGDAMQLFVDNFERFRKGEPLKNVIDKRAGY